MIVKRDQDIVESVGHYYTLTRGQINRLHLPGDKDGRYTRKRLSSLLSAGMISRTQMQVVNPAMGAPAPVYYPSRKGCEWLYAQTEDKKHLATCTLTPNWQHLYHWVQVAETHILLDDAVKKSEGVSVGDWLGE